MVHCNNMKTSTDDVTLTISVQGKGSALVVNFKLTLHIITAATGYSHGNLCLEITYISNVNENEGLCST